METLAFNKVTYGVYIVASSFEGKDSGCVITTLTQVTAEEKPKMTIAVNTQNYTNELIKKSRKVNISVLSEKAPLLLIGKFGFRSGRDFDKFEGTETVGGENGIKCVTEDAVAYFETKVIGETEAGTHTIFLLEVENAVKLTDDNSMTYDYYHRVVKGKTPPKAATFSK